jgi:microcin C transport system substrate-binding protein
MKLSRRRALTVLAGATAASVGGRLCVPAVAQDADRHGMSAFGDLKYPADFPHFSYVNPDAPKGGVFSQIGPNRQFNQSFQTFNSLNSYILKGDAAQGMELTFASLMSRSGDEPDAMYGFVARSVRISDEGLTYRFTLRAEPKFHDGTPLTAHDVVWSLATLKEKGHPIITQQLRDFNGAEVIDDRTLVVRFAEKRARDVPLFVASLPIFSRAYYSKKSFDESTLDIPLGNGVYRVGRFQAGHFIEYERVKDWWGANLPVSRGLSITATERWASKGSPLKITCSGKNSRRVRGQRVTNFRRSRTAESSAQCCRMTRHRVRKVGSSIRGATSSRTGACARR